MTNPLALVIEDSVDQTALLRRHLEREGFEVFAAADAETAIAAFDDIDPAVVVLDLLLPGISGQECAGLIRKRFPDCFLIISSVHDASRYPPADAALVKPIVGSDIRAILGRVPR